MGNRCNSADTLDNSIITIGGATATDNGHNAATTTFSEA
jgi:hypothetical protein